MAELLLELFSEEIPARMQDRAREDLTRLLGELLAEAGLAFDRPIRSYATPRRLTVVATGLPQRQPDRVVERKGPRADAPEQARAGFLRGLAGVEHTLEEREEKKARVLFAVIRERGREVGELLAELVPQAIQRLPWPKSMRWGSGDFRWVRPLHSILCLCDGRVVPFEVGGVRSGDATRGHRFLAPEPFAVRDFADYVVRLREAKVILDGAERRELIAREAGKLAAAANLVVADDPALLDELKGLVEWPVPLLGAIDEPFMELPPEVLVSTMRNNQKYLALRTRGGVLAPKFVIVANTVASDGGAAIVAGNERVLRARLWDAKFFWDQDRKEPLESRLPALDKMVFHAELGSLGERVQRLVALSGALTPHVPDANRSLAERAALLAKADLVAGMVGEFPELQGVIGAHYARGEGEPDQVVAAIRDQYAPRGLDDAIPSAGETVVNALADKLDMLVGFFAVGKQPTGSKDPFGLRRAALGVIRLLIENQIRLPLRTVLIEAYLNYLLQADFDLLDMLTVAYDERDLDLAKLRRIIRWSFTTHHINVGNALSELMNLKSPNLSSDEVRERLSEVISRADDAIEFIKYRKGALNHLEEIDSQHLREETLPRVEAIADLNAKGVVQFLADRLKVHLRERGVRHDLISAAFGVGGEDDLVRLLARVDALQTFLDTEDGRNLLAAYRRASNIVGIEERKDGRSYVGEPVAGALVEPVEETLWAALRTARTEIDRALAAEEYGSAMSALARLRRPVDSFFDAVMVNAPEPDLRENRLRLLSQIRSALERVADFSLIEEHERTAA